MKKITPFLFFLIFSFTVMNAQRVTYTYDAAGNRISRTIILSSPSRSAEKLFEETKPDPFTDVIGEKEIKIYPNPTRGYLTIDITGLEKGTETLIKLYNINGALIIQKKVDEIRTELNLTDQTPGTYLLEIMIGGKSTTWKIIKE